MIQFIEIGVFVPIGQNNPINRFSKKSHSEHTSFSVQNMKFQ